LRRLHAALRRTSSPISRTSKASSSHHAPGPEYRDRLIPCDAAVADTRHVLTTIEKAPTAARCSPAAKLIDAAGDVARLVRPRITLKVFPHLSGVPIEFG
jgi:hypothetical protein